MELSAIKEETNQDIQKLKKAGQNDRRMTLRGGIFLGGSAAQIAELQKWLVAQRISEIDLKDFE